MKKYIRLASVFAAVILAMTGCTAQQLGNSSEPKEAQQPTEITLYLVRHGRTMLNVSGRTQGWADAVLTPSGEEVVRAAGEGLKGTNFQNVYSSDSGRAVQTAELIAEKNNSISGKQITRDSRLREFGFGSYEGEFDKIRDQEIANELGISYQQFTDTKKPETIANLTATLDKRRTTAEAESTWLAENFETIKKRLTEGLDAIVAQELERNGSGNILIVSHGLSIGALLILFSGNPDIYNTKDGLTNVSVSTLKYKDGKYTVDKVNDVSHIAAGKGTS